MLFALFVVLTFVLLVRPEDVFGQIVGGQSYLVVMCFTLPFAARRIVERLLNLRDDPISCCVLAYYALTVASTLFNVGSAVAISVATEFGKVVVAYFVGLAALGPPRAFLKYLNVFPMLIAGVTLIGLLQYHEFIDNPAVAQCIQNDVDENGEPISYVRLCSCGVFNDPNDLCLALAVGLALCAYHLVERSSILMAILSSILVPCFLYALILTKSRGGLLAVAAMISSLFVSRFGSRRALPLAIASVFGLLVLAGGGRQTSIDTSSGTAQGRIQIWADGLAEWRTSPLIGIGHGQFGERVQIVAHNAYLHGFVESGYLGGTFFLGIFIVAIIGIARTPRIDDDETTPEEEAVNRSRPFIVAAVVGYCVGMYGVSRNYVIPTYLMAALANSCLFSSHPVSERTWFVMNVAMVRRLALVGALTLAALFTFVKVFVNYG